MKKLILIGITGLATLLAGAVAHLAGATPGTGVLGAPILARATLGVDVLVQMQTDTATELRWRDRAWTRNDLPEFLKALRDQGGVEDLGAWVGDHPAAAAKLGLPATRKVAAPDFAVQQVTLAPGGATGWHTHPGPAYVLVRSGSFTLYNGADSACRPTVYTAGQSFVDAGFGNVHIGRNEGPTNVDLYVVYIAPSPAGQAVRIDAAKPATSTCGF